MTWSFEMDLSLMTCAKPDLSGRDCFCGSIDEKWPGLLGDLIKKKETLSRADWRAAGSEEGGEEDRISLLTVAKRWALSGTGRHLDCLTTSAQNRNTGDVIFLLVCLLMLLLLGLLPFLSLVIAAPFDCGDDSAVFDDPLLFLNAVFECTNGPRWRNATGWGSTDDFCGWFGVLCDSNNNIVSLDLHSNGLEGPWPAGRIALNSIALWDLSGNAITGSLPHLDPSVAVLSMHLESNRFTAWTRPFPPSAQVLVLADNQIDTIDTEIFARQRDLELLDLDGNRLSCVPGELSLLPTIQTLTMSRQAGGSAAGTALPRIRSATLRYLVLDGLGLTGALPDLSEAPNLEMISLMDNDLSGPLTLLNVSSAIESIMVSNNRKVTGQIPAQWASLPSLSQLHLANLSLSGPVPDGWRALDSRMPLFQIDVSWSNLSGDFPMDVCKWALDWVKPCMAQGNKFANCKDMQRYGCCLIEC
jgi:hypothetical protein